MVDVVAWTKQHKIAAGLLLIVIVFSGFVMLSLTMIVLGGSNIGSMQGAADAGARYDTEASAPGLFDLSGDQRVTHDDAGSGAFVEVQEAEFRIDSDDVDGDEGAIRSLASTHEGYVEQSRKDESSLYRTIHLTVRVPDSEFEAFTDLLKVEYDVESFNVRNYRLSTQRELDELGILNRTLADYEELREEIRQMNTDEEKINLLMELTEKELAVKEKQQRYERSLADKQKRGDEATVRITLREQKSVDVWPENIGNRFMSNVKNMLNALVNIGVGTLTDAVVLFFRAVQAIIYLVVIAIPFLVAYRFGKRVYKEYWK